MQGFKKSFRLFNLLYFYLRQCMRANYNITSKDIPVSILLGEYNNIQGQRQNHLQHREATTITYTHSH